jgi:hypothetical protein
MVWPETDAQGVADLQLLGALGALAVDLDLPGLDCSRCNRAGFKEPRCPQPFVEADLIQLV